MMSSNGAPVRPPRVAAWFVEVFASPEEADAVLGDLAEEFSATIARDGDRNARHWYQREAGRTIRDLALSEWRTRPWSSAAIACVGLILIRWILPVGIVLTAPLQIAATALVSHYPVYDYISASLFGQIVETLG